MEAAFFLPAPPLAPYIRHYFAYAMDEAAIRREFPSGMHILPGINGKMGIFLSRPTVKRMPGQAESLNPQIGLSGFYGRPLSYHASSATSMIIVAFTPAGLQQMLDFSASEINDHNLDLKEASKGDYSFLCNEIYAAKGWNSQIRILDQFFIDKFRQTQFPSLAATIADHILRTGGQASVRSISDELFVGERTLLRAFKNGLGITPKFFSKLVRFQRALEAMSSHPQHSLTEIGHRLGYYDQAHFIHEFKSLYGQPPGAFRQQERSGVGQAFEEKKGQPDIPFI